MPGYALNISFAIVLIATIIAIVRRTQTPLQPDQTYCYESVKTLSPQHPKANCFSVSSSGIFTRVFWESELEALEGDVIRSNGNVIPGLWDGHGHVLGLGEGLQEVQLYHSKSLSETLGRVNKYVMSHPGIGSKEDWIVGTGWDQAAFGRWPTASDFDSDDLLKDKYIMLFRVDGHCMWVSNIVLKLLPDPIPKIPGGDVMANGVLCDNTKDLVMKHAPKADKKKVISQVKSAIKELNSVGLVGVHEAGVPPSRLSIYKELVDTEDWTIRIYAMLECEERNTFCPEDAVKLKREDGRLIVNSVKLFADGALGSWGSAMLEPYADHAHSTGLLVINGSVIKDLAHSWSQAGFQVNIHAIGDRANRYVIDAFEAAYPKLCPNMSPRECQQQRRFRIEHAQIIHPEDQDRMFAMGIIPSIQPTHATSDMSFAETRLGPDRTAHEAYRMNSFLPLHPVLGSDFPIEPPNPLHGMYAAVTRRSPRTGKGKHGSDEGWYLEEALNMSMALEGFTKSTAWGAFLEDKAGVIQEGAWADWVVLDGPFDEMQPENLLKARVRQTWVGGKLVYKR